MYYENFENTEYIQEAENNNEFEQISNNQPTEDLPKFNRNNIIKKKINYSFRNYHTNNDVYIAAGSSKGKVGIGTTAPTQQLEVGGNARVSGHLEIGKADKMADTGYATDNVGVDNYISFYGTYGDGPASFTHAYIGERVWGPKDTVNEASELFIAKGNDLGGGGTSGTTVSGAGPDRIRYSAGSHVF